MKTTPKLRLAKIAFIALLLPVCFGTAFAIWDRSDYTLPRRVINTAYDHSGSRKQRTCLWIRKQTAYLNRQKRKRLNRKQFKIDVQKFSFKDQYGAFIAHKEGRLYLYFRADQTLQWRLHPKVTSAHNTIDISDLLVEDLTWQRIDHCTLSITSPNRIYRFKIVPSGGTPVQLTFDFREAGSKKREFKISFRNRQWNKDWFEGRSWGEAW